MADATSRLKEIVDAYIERDGGAGVDTGIVASHIAQMKLFGVRQGVEFFPSQDNFGAQRKDFIDKVVKYNKLDTFFGFPQIFTIVSYSHHCHTKGLRAYSCYIGRPARAEWPTFLHS